MPGVCGFAAGRAVAPELLGPDRQGLGAGELPDLLWLRLFFARLTQQSVGGQWCDGAGAGAGPAAGFCVSALSLCWPSELAGADPAVHDVAALHRGLCLDPAVWPWRHGHLVGPIHRPGHADHLWPLRHHAGQCPGLVPGGFSGRRQCAGPPGRGDGRGGGKSGPQTLERFLHGHPALAATGRHHRGHAGFPGHHCRLRTAQPAG